MNTTTKFTFEEVTPNLLADLSADLTPMLIGQPGIGKSSVLKNLANKLNTKVFVLSVNQLGTKEDLTGARTIKDPKTNTYRQVFFPHADVQDAIDYAKAHPNETPILFLDEINRTSTDVTSAALALITERRLGTTKLPSNLRLIAAGNDQGNVISFDNASITRLSLYRVAPDLNSFLSAQPDMNPYIVDVLKSNPSLLVSAQLHEETEDQSENKDDDDEESNESLNFNDMFDDNQFIQETVPRTITYTSKYLTALGFTKKHDDAEHKAFNNYLNAVSNVDKNPDTLLKGLLAHAGNTSFTLNLYDTIKSNLMNAFQRTNNAEPEPTVHEFTLPKVDDDLITKLLAAKTNDEIEAIIAPVSAKVYQDLFLYSLTDDGVTKLGRPVVKTLYDNLGLNLNKLNDAITKESEKLNGNDKAQYLQSNQIEGLDKDHKSLYINLLTHDDYPVSSYSVDLLRNLDGVNTHISMLKTLMDVLS